MAILNQKPAVVFGQVFDKLNRPLPNLLVRAFDRDMRSEELLGEQLSDNNGQFRILYSKEKFLNAEKKTADLLIKVFNATGKAALYTAGINDIRYNASDSEQINIVIENNIPVDLNEFDFIIKEITPLIGKVKIADLQEDSEQQDISFLFNEASIPAEKLEHLVVANRLSNESNINAAFFYALLRQNTLLKNELTTTMQVRLGIDINTDILPLLYQAAITDVKIIEKDIKAAITAMIIPPLTAKEIIASMAILQRCHAKATEYYKNEHPKKLIDTISRFLLSNKISEVSDEFAKSKNDLDTFFDKISGAAFFKNKADANEAKITTVLTEILGADDAIISHITKA